MPLRPFCHAVIALGILLNMSTPAEAADALPTPAPAPLRPILPGGRLVIVATPPDLTAAEPLADPAFARAQPLGGLFLAGRPEPADRATTMRLVRCGETLFLAVECRDTRPPQPFTGADATGLWKGDSLEIFLAGTPPDSAAPTTPAASATPALPATVPPTPPYRDTPYTHLAIGADGRAVAWRYSASSRGADEAATDGLGVEQLKIRTGVGPNGNGWWLCAAIPADPFAPDWTGLRGNFFRNLAGETSYSWCDMNGNSAHQPDRFAPLAAVPPPPADANLPATHPLPALQLPAALAVGRNRLTVLHPAPGFTLHCGSVALPLDQPVVELPVTASGIAHLSVHHPALLNGAALREYEVCIRRPIFLSAAQPFAADLDQPIACQLALNVAADQPVPVTLEARQQDRVIGSLKIDAAAGLQTVSIPIEKAQPGEISLNARAALPLAAAETLTLTAGHLCVRGQTADDLNRFRADLDRLDLRQRYRAMFADAAGFLRLIQAADGRVRSINRRGDLAFSEWNYGAAYIFAVAYTADWPENPHKGDKRFLVAALHALEAGIDPEAKMPSGGHSRHLRPLTLTYDLIQADLDPPTRAHVREQLTEMVDDAVRHRLIPAARRYTMYSEDLGTGTNHFAYYCTGVLAAGRVLNRPDWTALASTFLTRLADHGRDGQFPERPGVSASHYTWLTMHALGQYYADMRDPALLPVLKNCADYAVHTTLPIKAPFLLHDGRNNEYGGSEAGAFVLSLTPAGRGLARQLQLEHSQAGRRPTHSDPQFWYRTADDAMYCQTGDTAELPGPAEFTFLNGRALLARRSGFGYGLSTIPLPPTRRTYWVDPQNFLELHSLTLGPVLHGANSQQQPEAGTFLRTLGERTEFLPVEGTIAKLPNGHAALLQFPSFNARVAITVQDQRHAQVSVQVLNRTGTEPVTFNFFPGVAQSADLTVSADGKTLQFGEIVIRCSAPVKLERDFKILNPYTLKRTGGSKPVRAHIDLTDNTALTLSIEQP